MVFDFSKDHLRAMQQCNSVGPNPKEDNNYQTVVQTHWRSNQRQVGSLQCQIAFLENSPRIKWVPKGQLSLASCSLGLGLFLVRAIPGHDHALRWPFHNWIHNLENLPSCLVLFAENSGLRIHFRKNHLMGIVSVCGLVTTSSDKLREQLGLYTY